MATNLPSAVPVTASISNYDDIAYKTKTPNANQVHTVSSSVNQRDNLEDNQHEDQSPYIQCMTAENLDSNQLQFFRTVNTILLLMIQFTAVSCAFTVKPS